MTQSNRAVRRTVRRWQPPSWKQLGVRTADAAQRNRFLEWLEIPITESSSDHFVPERSPPSRPHFQRDFFGFIEALYAPRKHSRIC
jgi:hypothetical protein